MSTTLVDQADEAMSETISETMQNLKQVCPTAEFKRLDIDDIFMAKEENVRSLDRYNEDKLQELQAGIEAVGGILQPISVTECEPSPENGNRSYMLTFGFRRYIVLSRLAADVDPKYGKQVPCIVVPRADTFGALKMIQLIENRNRHDLNHMETAKAIEDALGDKECNYTGNDVARILGMSAANVSQIRKLLKLPKVVQDMLNNEEITFSNVRTIMTLVPEEHWVTAAEASKGVSPAKFEKDMQKAYGKATAGDGATGEAAAAGTDGAAAVSTGNDSSQKPAQLVRVTVLEKTYVPFLQQRAKEANSTDKLFTAKDIEEARLDAIKTVMQSPNTQLAAAILPFAKKQEEEAANEKAKANAEKNREKFYRAQVKKAEALFNAPVDPTNLEAKRPTWVEVYGVVTKEVMELQKKSVAKPAADATPEAIAKHEEELKKLREEVGFDLDSDPSVISKAISEMHATIMNERKEAKAAHEKAKAEKEAKEAKEKAEAEAKAAAGAK